MITTLQSGQLGQALLNVTPPSPAGAPAGDFAALLATFASDTIATLRAGETAAIDGLAGRAPVQEVVEKVMAAEQALHAGIALRDKIVAAYLEISRMTI